MDIQLILETDGSREEIFALQEWIEESKLKGLQMKVKKNEETITKNSSMGAEALPILDLIVQLAGSAAVVAFINGLFGCIKAYILSNHKTKQIVFQKGNSRIIFNSDSIKDLQLLIDNSLDLLTR